VAWVAAQLAQALLFNAGPYRFPPGAEARFREVRPALVKVGCSEGVPPALLTGLALKESSLRPDAQGPPLSGGVQALGLGQVLPSTFERHGFSDWSSNWTDPEYNLRATVAELRARGLGHAPVREVLAKYGGFVTADPTDYVTTVLTWATIFSPRFLGACT